MPAERTDSETRPLLAERPPSYHSTDDVSTAHSKCHVRWILVGLWSAVLLGAFDGAYPTRSPPHPLTNPPQAPSSPPC